MKTQAWHARVTKTVLPGHPSASQTPEIGDVCCFPGSLRSPNASSNCNCIHIHIPVTQVLVAVFPWRVNGWFGIGFLVYYLLMTPLLFQVNHDDS